MITSVNGALYRDMIANGAAAIEKNKEMINELNVFPVPDGDTGTNMSLTMSTCTAAMDKAGAVDISKAADITASSLLRSARGNSGVILSLLFRGMGKAFKGLQEADTKAFAEAFNKGVSAAYKAVMKPTEGTILTVSRLMAEAATEIAEKEKNFEFFFEDVLKVGEEALAHTIDQNPVLKKAGVVDAGGKGYLIIVDGMLKALRGEVIEVTASQSTVPNEKANFADFETGDITFAYCTEFIISRENENDPDDLRSFLGGIGDSLVVVDDDEIIKVHVHTNDPGCALTQAIKYGSLLTVKIENMKEQHSEKLGIAEEEAAEPKVAAPEKKYGVVAVCAGDGLAAAFSELGVDRIITGGQTMNPSTDDILTEINKTPAEIVFVLPNNKNIIMAAEQCKKLSTEKKVVIVPTKTVPQGVSAMCVFDESMEEEELQNAMMEAASGVHTVQITYAARDSEFDGMHIQAGEYLALLESALIANEADFSALLAKVCDAIGPFDPELITLFYGEDVDEEAAEATANRISLAFPDAELTPIPGGQPVYYYMISVE